MQQWTVLPRKQFDNIVLSPCGFFSIMVARCSATWGLKGHTRNTGVFAFVAMFLANSIFSGILSLKFYVVVLSVCDLMSHWKQRKYWRWKHVQKSNIKRNIHKKICLSCELQLLKRAKVIVLLNSWCSISCLSAVMSWMWRRAHILCLRRPGVNWDSNTTQILCKSDSFML